MLNTLFTVWHWKIDLGCLFRRIYAGNKKFLFPHRVKKWCCIEIVAEGGGTFPDQEHQANFVEALQRKSKPNGDAEQCHRSAVLVHLGNIAYRVGNKQLLFDGEKERFTNDDKANELARGTYREGYSVPENV